MWPLFQNIACSTIYSRFLTYYKKERIQFSLTLKLQVAMFISRQPTTILHVINECIASSLFGNNVFNRLRLKAAHSYLFLRTFFWKAYFIIGNGIFQLLQLHQKIIPTTNEFSTSYKKISCTNWPGDLLTTYYIYRRDMNFYRVNHRYFDIMHFISQFEVSSVHRETSLKPNNKTSTASFLIFKIFPVLLSSVLWYSSNSSPNKKSHIFQRNLRSIWLPWFFCLSHTQRDSDTYALGF